MVFLSACKCLAMRHYRFSTSFEKLLFWSSRMLLVTTKNGPRIDLLLLYTLFAQAVAFILCFPVR